MSRLIKRELSVVFVIIVLQLINFTNSLASTDIKQVKSCVVTRTVLDIGSGSTKLVSAEVDRCRGKIIAVKMRGSEKVKYKEDLISSKGKFSSTIQNQGKEAIKKLISQTTGNGPIIALATSAFRDAQNAQAFKADLETAMGIKIFIIPQEEEARLGLKGAIAQSHEKEEDVLVWDIGGGSMQLTAIENGQLRYSLNGWGSAPTKQWFLTSIQQKKESESPLPVARVEILSGLKKLADLTRDELNIKIKELAKKRKVLGIGGVIYFNICPLIEGKKLGCEFSQDELDVVLASVADKNAQQLGAGPFVDEAVTNPLLVKSFMENLGIQSVQTMEINLGDGALVEEVLWK